ncbi:hypothetical protein ACIBQ1_18675 [Nonomuraea sp. NPDC050153]|uniref:hypothetical protein n=1 Tax=Nonomuraea sp. NPDC050153 TaxID=3364359 RepID=UPI0037AF96AD
MNTGAAHAEPVAGTITVANDAWTQTSRQFPDRSYWNEGTDVFIGLHPDTGDLNRSFFRLDLSRLREMTVTKATLELRRHDRCVPYEKGFQLWQTSRFDGETTWVNEPGWTRLIGAYPGAWGKCPPPGYDGYDSFRFDITNYVRQAIGLRETSLYLGARSAEEDDPLGRIDLSTYTQAEVSFTGPQAPPLPVIPGSPASTRIKPAAWALVSQRDPDTPYWNGDTGPSAGLDPSIDAKRSYARYDLTPLIGKRLLGAHLVLRRQTPCEEYERGFELWFTGPITDQTTWNEPAEWIRKVTGTVPSAACSTADPFVLNASDAVPGSVAAGRTEITVGLRSRDEQDVHGYYAFQPAPELEVFYNAPRSASSSP